jgi:hypothetical protein
MAKTSIVRVVPNLSKVLTKMTAEEQEQFFTDTLDIETKLIELDQYRTASRSLAEDNASLRKQSHELKEVLAKESERLYNKQLEVGFLKDYADRLKERNALKTQVVDAELEGGAKIRISVPIPQVKINTSELATMDRVKHQLI